MPREDQAGMGGAWPQAQGCWGLQELEEGAEEILPLEAPSGGPPTSDVWSLG